jgi:hypothetical protein
MSSRATKHTTTVTRRRTPATLQKLCAQFHAKNEAYNKAIAKLQDAEEAAQRASPQPPLSIQPTKAVLADMPSYRWHHRAIPSTFFQSELTSLKKNTTLMEEKDGITVIRHSVAGFPLTDKERARVGRLQKMLADAKHHERACAKVQRRFKISKLEGATAAIFRSQEKLIAKIEKARSKNRQDVLAKVRVYLTDSGMFGDAYVEKMLNEVTKEMAKGASR